MLIQPAGFRDSMVVEGGVFRGSCIASLFVVLVLVLSETVLVLDG